MRLVKTLFLVGALSFIVACSSDNDNGSANTTNNNNNAGSNNNNNAKPSSNSNEVSADEGGTVALADGASISIPAGALSADVEITLESSEPDDSLPDFDSIQGLAYDFGPDGTTFNVPVELTLPLVGEPGDDEEAVVSWLNEDTNRWEDLPTTVARGEVVAEITHFTLFVVRFKDVEVGAFDCEFDDNCTGGNLVGEWTIQGACVDVPNPFEEFCADATFDIGSTMEGTVTFNDDGTYSTNVTTGGNFSVVIPASCLPGVGACEEIFGNDNDGDGTIACTGTPATSCDCTISTEPTVEMETGTYTTDGNQLTMTDDADQNDTETHTYCVTGDNLKAKMVEEPEEGEEGEAPTTIVWAATR